MNETSNLHIAVIGAGPGGYAAAFLAADLGMKVTLIDSEPNPGGVCLYRGCIPSKALLHVAKVIDESRHAKNWGIEFAEPKIDIARLRSFKESVVNKLTSGVGQIARFRKVEYLQGRAAFENSTTLKVTKADGGTQSMSFDRIVIATGSRPAVVPSLKLDTPRMMDSTGALNLEDAPKTLLVVGGGYIGLELGTVYAALRTKVSVVEMTGGLLPGADRDLVLPLHKRMEKIFDSIMLNTTVTGVKEEANGIRVSFDGSEVKEREKVFDKVLVSVGRKPNSEIPGLENTQVKVGQRGFIQVNKQLQTDDPAIYAIGDVIAGPMLAHKAEDEGIACVEIIAGKAGHVNYEAIASIIYTNPELAGVGLTEDQAREKGIDVRIGKFPFRANSRALTGDDVEGMVKFVADAKTDRILGGHILHHAASELIAEAVSVIEFGGSSEDIGRTTHSHPTLSEAVREAALNVEKRALHIINR